MHISVGDYLLVEGPKDKPQLAKAMAVKQGMVRVRIEKDAHLPDLRVIQDVEQRAVVANYGPTPHKKIAPNLYLKTVQHPVVGDVHFFYKPEPQAAQSLNRAFNMVHTKLKKNGLHHLIEDTIVWEVLSGEGGGKYAGMYYPKQKGLETPRIRVRPEKMPASSFPYVILHELGHHMHFAYCMDNDNLNGAWVKMYNRSIKVTPVSEKDCRALCKAFEASGTSVNGFKRDLDDDSKKNFGKILSYIRTNHQLSPTEINILISSNNWSEVEACWPTQVTNKDLEPMVSEYATKNMRELLAESFALHYGGTALPKAVVGLLEKTVNYAKSQFGG